MATINPLQDYDIIHKLTFNIDSGSCAIRLFRGAHNSQYSGAVYYRVAGGNWTELLVSGTDTTFPITNAEMEVGYNWNKSGDNYMTASFYNEDKIIKIEISQKEILNGKIGNAFMYGYVFGCTALKSIDVVDTSDVTEVGNYFFGAYIYGATGLEELQIPNTSKIIKIGDSFMSSYARNCGSLKKLDVPNTSKLTELGGSFLNQYAYDCSSLEELDVPNTSKVTKVGSAFLGYYARGCSQLKSLAIPDTSKIESVGGNFMATYALNCSSLERLELSKAGWFKTNNVNWSIPAGRVEILKGYVKKAKDLTDWQELTTTGKTLYTNYIRSSSDVILEATAIKNIFVGEKEVTDIKIGGQQIKEVYKGSNLIFEK